MLAKCHFWPDALWHRNYIIVISAFADIRDIGSSNMLETIELRVRLLELSQDVDQAHVMLDSFQIPRAASSGSVLSVVERLEYLREQLNSAELRQTAVLEAARAYRVSKEHYYRANDNQSMSHIQMAERALLKAVNRLNRGNTKRSEQEKAIPASKKE